MNQLKTTQGVVANQAPTVVEKLTDRVFDQLIASCPILLTTAPEQLKIIKQQWVLGFAENGVTTLGKVKRGMRAVRAKTNGYLPSVGEFVAWCNAVDYAELGLPTADELPARVAKFQGFYGQDDELQFNFKSNAEYWLLTDLCGRGRRDGWSASELRKEGEIALKAMVKRIESGETIPEPRKQLPAQTSIPTTREKAQEYINSIKAMFRPKVAQDDN